MLFGLVEAFVLILFYIGKVDWFAIVLSVLPLFYSYVVGAKGAKYRHEFNQALTFPTRKKNMRSGYFICLSMQKNCGRPRFPRLSRVFMKRAYQRR